MKIKALVDKALKEAVLETFECMELDGRVVKPDSIAGEAKKKITWSWTEITEPLKGQMVLLMPERLQREVFLRMVHAGVDEVTKEDLIDVQSELTNILAGRLINMLIGGSVSPSFTLPQTGSGVPNVRSGSWRYLGFEIGDSWILVFISGEELVNFGAKDEAGKITRSSGFHVAVDIGASIVPSTTRRVKKDDETSSFEAESVESMSEISGKHNILQDNADEETIVAPPRSKTPETEFGISSSARLKVPEGAKGNKVDMQPLRLGGYSIKKKIGQGAMSSVFLAVQENLNRLVAIKVMDPKFNEDPTYEKRFHREARLAAAVTHPNVVSIHDVGKDNNFLYMALQYVSGGDLAQVLEKDGSLSEKEVISMFISILHGLQAIEDAELVHRDIKPANILLGYDGTPLIGDLGMARPPEEEHENEELTMAGTLVGTPAYMSPEQALGTTDIDIRSDIFSLGVTMYLTLTGNRPFEGVTPMETIMKIIKDPMPNPRDEKPEISKGIVGILKKALEKEPSKRFQHPKEFADALDALREGSGVTPKASWLHRLFGGAD